MVITRTSNEIIIRIPDTIDIDEIQRFINYLNFKEIASKSKATQEEADELARSVNKNWWKKNKPRFLKDEDNN